MIRHILREQGYQVLSALNGVEALSLLAQIGDGTVHLLITDIIMPKIGGRELVERVHTFEPDMKVLYMSGYTDNTIVTEKKGMGVIDFIQKPFATVDFLKKVRILLDFQAC